MRASDGSLNSGFSAASSQVKVDRSAPSSPNASTDPASPVANSGGWFKDSVTVGYGGSSDPNLADGSSGSGVAGYTPDQTFDASGTHGYSGVATDGAGNTSSAITGQVKVDATDPQISFSDCPSAVVDAQNPGNAHYAASDQESGLDSSGSGSVSLSDTPGLHTATATATDKVGHTKTASCTYTVNSAPTSPGTPEADSSPNQGAFELTWDAATDPDSNLDHYLLQHKDSGASADWSNVATIDSSSHSYGFDSSAKEAEGTWHYRVLAVDAMEEQATSNESDPVKVDRSGPNPPSAHTDRSPEDAAGGYFKDTVTVSYADNGDPDLPDGSSGSGVASISGDQTFDASGTHGYSGKATDQLGNDSDPTQGTVKVDATDPSVDISGCPAALLARDSSHSVDLTASDGESGLVSDPSGETPLDTSTAGQHTLGIEVADKVGHTKTASCTYTVNSAPTSPGTPEADSSPNQGAFELTWDAATDPDSNLDHYLLQHKDSGASADWSNVATIDSSSHSYGFDSSAKEAEGTWHYRVLAVDAMEEQATSNESDPVKVDRSGPNPPSAHTDRSPEDAAGGYFKDTVTVSYADNGDPDLPDGSSGSGVASISGDQTFDASGTHGYSGKATDQLGNDSDPTQGTVKVDATDPSVDISGCPAALLARDSSHSVDLTASDGESGLVSDPSGETPLDTSTAGQHTLGIEVADKVGHTKTASCTYTVNSAPTSPGTPEADSSPNQGAFELTWDAATDPDSNLDHYLLQHKDSGASADWSNVATIDSSSHSYGFDSSAKEAEGTWHYRVLAVDAMEEQATSNESDPVKVDRSGPNPPSAHTDRSPEDAAGGYFKDTVTVSYADNGDPDLPDGSSGSGVKDLAPSSHTFAQSGTFAYSGKANDNAGNQSTATIGSIKVDASNPTIDITGCPTIVPLETTRSIQVAAADSGAGLVTDPERIDLAEHRHDRNQDDDHHRCPTRWATRRPRLHYTVGYNWMGFFSPVDNNGVYNVAKAGSAIPIKFSLDGTPRPGNDKSQGTAADILGSSVPNPASDRIDCSSAAQLDVIEQTASPGASSLTYDAAADQYVYVWKTQSNYAGTCRQLAIRFADGSVQRANFKFTK